MKRNLIAVVLLGLASAQAGVALANDNTDVFADPYWTASRQVMAPEATRLVAEGQAIPGASAFDSYAQ